MLKCVKYCLKTENGCLKTQTKHPLVIELLCCSVINYGVGSFCSCVSTLYLIYHVVLSPFIKLLGSFIQFRCIEVWHSSVLDQVKLIITKII